MSIKGTHRPASTLPDATRRQVRTRTGRGRCIARPASEHAEAERRSALYAEMIAKGLPIRYEPRD